MTDLNDLTLEDLTDDNIPPDASICPGCGGWGIVFAWSGGLDNIMGTSEDCDKCEGNGWVLTPNKNDVKIR